MSLFIDRELEGVLTPYDTPPTTTLPPISKNRNSIEGAQSEEIYKAKCQANGISSPVSSSSRARIKSQSPRNRSSRKKRVIASLLPSI